MNQKSKLWHPYLGGLFLGLLLLVVYFFTGKELGASGTFNRIMASVEYLFAPQRTVNHSYFGKLFRYGHFPLLNYLIFLSIGTMIGGFISGVLSGRAKPEVLKGEKASTRTRLILAFLGGSLVGFATRFTRGCTSGLALSSGGLLSPGAWIFMLSVFAGGYAFAYFVRKEWL